MKTGAEIERAIQRLINSKTKYPGMTYEDGIEEALLWVLGEIEDSEFTYAEDEQ